MKYIFLISFMIGISSLGYSQIEFNNKFKPIPIKEKPPEEKKENPIPPNNEDLFAVEPVIKVPKAYTKPDPLKSNSSFEIGKDPKTISMIKKNEFLNPGDVFKDNMTKDLSKTLVREGLKEDSGYLVKIDVNFGDIRTKSEYFLIKCRDFGAIDGDLIKATLNTDIVKNRMSLQGDYQEFRIYFKEGINTFELEALNRGALGGNTAEFHIYDDQGKLVRSDFWENWDTGVKGTFVIVKE